MALFGGRRRVEELEVELARARTALAEAGALDEWQRAQRRQAAEQQLARVLGEEHAARIRLGEVQLELAGLQSEVIETRADALLQAAGVYDYVHPLDTAVAYKEQLTHLKADIKIEVTARRAVTGRVDWSVNGSRPQGAKMVKDFSTLMLRAYNADADNCVRTVKPHTLGNTLRRLDKTRATIAKLGRTMSIEIAERYHRLRIYEIELTADYLAKVETERELIRAQKEAAREEERARREFEREKQKLLKEQAHYSSAYQRLITQRAADPSALAEIRAHLDKLGADIATVDARAANTRAGYVYVISNIGSFGEQVVKIGMTRRLEPMDRVRELGDASVPFRFDVHALVFSDDAVGLEGRLHAALAEQRVNKVNQHREFFRTTPAEVRGLLVDTAGSHLLEFTETVEALEWRASGASATFAPLPPETSPQLPSEDDETVSEPSVAGKATRRQLPAGELVPLDGLQHLRLVLQAAEGTDAEIDPIAFLLSDRGVVRSDSDMVFYGQPDHPSNAITLASDDTGAPTALHVMPANVPDDVTEILLVAQLPANHAQSPVLDALDLDSGRPIGRLQLPTPGPTGLLQLGAMHRVEHGWVLQPEPSRLDHDLAGLAAAAGVDVT
ncbi:DUF4041 domain-containing protein [Pseudonocardia kunmingensis]|uniref:Stress response protein SCP2 n=1 Tax=Pseudonocardia kunmingensis TaxID=630975 RepID=A0A543DPA6_9PSEU|nr:DUF4041 domain-containing protein [Pseudonocardia kunmingensis]TQM11157.1 stress response protein SCP2 [Pseudonocardia kunmingensis]